VGSFSQFPDAGRQILHNGDRSAFEERTTAISRLPASPPPPCLPTASPWFRAVLAAFDLVSEDSLPKARPLKDANG